MPVIKQHIDFSSTSTAVLDIGCGSGSWVMVSDILFIFTTTG